MMFTMNGDLSMIREAFEREIEEQEQDEDF